MLNIFRPSLGEEELAEVRELFLTGWVGRGKKATEFEQAFAQHLGVSASSILATNSCTSATFLAMELIGIGPGDEVVIPTISFVGVANAVARRGARPVFVDVDPRTLNPTALTIERAIGPDTRAVCVLHYGGAPGEIKDIARICSDSGVLLIEDAANAPASTDGNVACGTFGDIGVWSFDHGKIAVAVDGGMLYVRDAELAERARKLAYFGLEQTSGFDQARIQETRWWEFDVGEPGGRIVLNDVLAAVGITQLGKLDRYVQARAHLASTYDALLSELVPAIDVPPPVDSHQRNSHYLYWIQLDPGKRDGLAKHLYDEGIYTTFRYHPLHRVAAFQQEGAFLNAESAAERTLCLPIHQSLTVVDVERVVREIQRFTSRNGSAVS